MASRRGVKPWDLVLRFCKSCELHLETKVRRVDVRLLKFKPPSLSLVAMQMCRVASGGVQAVLCPCHAVSRTAGQSP
jgi:hypothetical protein